MGCRCYDDKEGNCLYNGYTSSGILLRGSESKGKCSHESPRECERVKRALARARPPSKRRGFSLPKTIRFQNGRTLELIQGFSFRCLSPSYRARPTP